MNKAAFEVIGNVGAVEIKSLKGGKQLAVLSVATSERWKRDDGEWTERTFWHRVAVFGAAQSRSDSGADSQDHVARIAAQVGKGTRVRLVGQIRPTRYDESKGVTRYAAEFVVGAFGEVDVLARPKLRDAEQSSSDPAPSRGKRGKNSAASDTTFEA